MAQVIDAHVHLLTGTPGNEYLPPHLRWAMCMGWAYGRTPPWDRDPQDFYPRQEERVSDPDGSATVAALEEAGVDSAVLIHADFGPSYGGLQPKSAEEMHSDYAELQKRYPGKLYAFAGPDVRRPGSLDLVRKSFQDWGFKGLKIMPHLGYFVSDPMLYPFYQTCLEYNKPVALCTNFEPAFNPFSRGRFNDPLYVTDVVADFPDMNVIIFHCGYPFEHWFEICMGIGRSALNTYMEIDAWMLGFSHAPEIISEEDSIRRLARVRDVVGAHRIIFGSDAQFANSSFGKANKERYIRRVQFWKELPKNAPKYGINFSQEEVDLMMGLNLARLMGLVDMPEYTKKRKYGWTILMPGPRPTP